jgi:hypothetical protein
MGLDKVESNKVSRLRRSERGGRKKTSILNEAARGGIELVLTINYFGQDCPTKRIDLPYLTGRI